MCLSHSRLASQNKLFRQLRFRFRKKKKSDKNNFDSDNKKAVKKNKKTKKENNKLLSCQINFCAPE